jgi:hypothetical protein
VFIAMVVFVPSVYVFSPGLSRRSVIVRLEI